MTACTRGGQRQDERIEGRSKGIVSHGRNLRQSQVCSTRGRWMEGLFGCATLMSEDGDMLVVRRLIGRKTVDETNPRERHLSRLSFSIGKFNYTDQRKPRQKIQLIFFFGFSSRIYYLVPVPFEPIPKQSLEAEFNTNAGEGNQNMYKVKN